MKRYDFFKKESHVLKESVVENNNNNWNEKFP